jgi:hypothetical protein
MSAPWQTPPPPDKFNLKNYAGRPIMLFVGGVHHDIQTKEYGIKTAIRCVVVSLVGPDAGTRYDDVLIFSSRVVGRLKAAEPGFTMLGRVTVSGAAVDVEDPAGFDEQAAHAWFTANPGVFEATRTMAMQQFQQALAETANPTPGTAQWEQQVRAQHAQQQPAQPQYDVQQPAYPQAPPPQYQQQPQPQYAPQPQQQPAPWQQPQQVDPFQPQQQPAPFPQPGNPGLPDVPPF